MTLAFLPIISPIRQPLYLPTSRIFQPLVKHTPLLISFETSTTNWQYNTLLLNWHDTKEKLLHIPLNQSFLKMVWSPLCRISRSFSFGLYHCPYLSSFIAYEKFSSTVCLDLLLIQEKPSKKSDKDTQELKKWSAYSMGCIPSWHGRSRLFTTSHPL